MKISVCFFSLLPLGFCQQRSLCLFHVAKTLNISSQMIFWISLILIADSSLFFWHFFLFVEGAFLGSWGLKPVVFLSLRNGWRVSVGCFILGVILKLMELTWVTAPFSWSVGHWMCVLCAPPFPAVLFKAAHPRRLHVYTLDLQGACVKVYHVPNATG